MLLATKDEISEQNSAVYKFSNGNRQPLCRWNLDYLFFSLFILLKSAASSKMFPLQLDYLVCHSSCPLRHCPCQSLHCTMLQVVLCRYKILCAEKSCAQEHRLTFTILWKSEPHNFLDIIYHFCDSLIWWVTMSRSFLLIYYFFWPFSLLIFISQTQSQSSCPLHYLCMVTMTDALC